MADIFTKIRHGCCSPGGLKCSCCNPSHSKNRETKKRIIRSINKRARTRLKKYLEIII